MHRFSHARIIGVAIVAVLGITAACSDDATTTAESSSNLGDTTATSAGTRATGGPIRIGFVNSEGGAFSVPELRVGNEVAETYINDQLGGVNGRPLQVSRCTTDGSPEASIDCANQLVEDGVVAVVEGTDLGGDAMLPILADAGIPLVGHVQFGPGRMFDDNSYDVSGSIAATDAQCAEMIGALRDAGYQGRILAASCVGLYEALGDDAVGVDTDADHWHPGDTASAPADKRAELEEYAAVMQAAGQEDLISGNAIITFADMINLSRIMATVEGPVDGAAVAGALRATTDFDSYAGPTISCDRSVIPGNSACSTDLLFFQVQDDGSVETVTDDYVDVTGLLG
jgi:ABC-type branched-subunit amino acid transport system substrate-binding protein